ncbi:TPA: hypothetical protein IAC10_12760 [Candidatus Scatousia excrementigallinarum]|uniref:Uncharacterized protein n=1 Tax=Candidatus Scatousia excrementigallinarum TaxID=2840935 RepID=A0A9D1F1G5_9BACT|nr:hypothetical protein [Candidatus Scatousia excrementigallinarum]
MYHVYTERDYSEFSRTLIGEYTDLDEAKAVAEKAIKEDSELNYIILETDGHVNNYGDLITTVVAQS